MSSSALDEALAVLDAAVAARDAERVEALAASPDRAVAKAARRALYRLRSAGVATHAPGPVAAPPAAEPEGLPPLPSLLAPPDGTGEFLLMVTRPTSAPVQAPVPQLQNVQPRPVARTALVAIQASGRHAPAVSLWPAR